MVEAYQVSHEEIVALQDAERFVQANRVQANDQAVECGDGRYTPDESNGFIRAFGGDVGMIAAVLSAVEAKKLGKFSGEIIERYIGAIKKLRGEDATIHFHTDESHVQDFSVGCRDIAQAQKSEYASLYGASSSGMIVMFSNINTLHPEDFSETVLQGEHIEKGILFVDGDEDDEESLQWSVNSFDPRTNENYFVIDIARARKFINQLVPVLDIQGLKSQDVSAAFMERTFATAKLLGNNLPWFTVGFDKTGNADVAPLRRELKK